MVGKINLVILEILGEQQLGGVPTPLHAHLARSASLSAAFQDEKHHVRSFAPIQEDVPSWSHGVLSCWNDSLFESESHRCLESDKFGKSCTPVLSFY